MDLLESRIEQEGLDDLITTCAQVSSDCMSVANCLNTAPVTLSSLAKESRAVTEALDRLHDLCISESEDVSESVRASNNKYVYSVARDIHELKAALKRIKGPDRDSGIDVGEPPSLVIVWNESALKEILKRLRTHQASLHTLLNTAIRSVFSRYYCRINLIANTQQFGV